MAGTKLRRDPRHGDALAYLVYGIDAVLRRIYRVEEFVDDPDCLLRLAKKRTSAAIFLDDGTDIMPGDPVGELHLWNAHLPRFGSAGPTLGWASQAHRLMTRSMRLLAEHVGRDPGWLQVQAFYADVPISALRPVAVIRRAAHRYGLEIVPVRQAFWRPVLEALESILLWGLAYAYNRRALRRRNFLWRRQRLWIGRATLLRLYRGDARANRCAPEPGMEVLVPRDG
jgi:hypothetical protein